MKYEEYKDSGVEWIGEVPSHWEVMKTSLAFNHIGSGTTPSTSKKEYYDDEGAYWLQTGDLTDGLIFDTSKKVSKIAVKECNLKFYPQNSVVIAMYGATIGKMGLLQIQCATNQACCVLPSNKYIDAKYTFYFFLSAKSDLLISAIGGGQPNISQDVIKKTKIILPPFSEQQAIANYLEDECGKINSQIAKANHRIELLEELKQTVITDAVTKGLDPNAPMKDSGVEWIGKVPIHWEVMRLRFACEFRNGYTPSKANLDFWENGSIPWYRMEDIRESGRFLNEAKQYITRKAVKGNGLFEAGSFILATTATIGEHAVLIADSLANQQFTNLKICKSLSNRLSRDFFFYYLFVIDDYCKSTTRTATFPAVNMDDLKNFGVTIPPLQEQQAIVAHIEDEVGKIDSRISRANRRIELLEELKQSIITEAVTGKIKVC